MARSFNVPVQSRAANTYGPFTIDGRQVGDNGAVIQISRGNDGVWPLTATDAVLTAMIELLYGAEWFQVANATFFGGTQQIKGGATKLLDQIRIEWPKINQNGVLVPDPPDQVRATFITSTTLPVGAAVQWL